MCAKKTGGYNTKDSFWFKDHKNNNVQKANLHYHHRKQVEMNDQGCGQDTQAYTNTWVKKQKNKKNQH